MSNSYGRSTYAQIIDDLRYDVQNGVKLARLSDEAIQKWILEAQERVASLIQIEDSYPLGLNEGVADYPYLDRPAITNATTATPIVLSSVGHGLSDGDRIFVMGVVGNDAANGQFQVYAKTADTFSLKRALDITAASNESPIAITAENHGCATGDSVTISGVLGNTAANGTFTVTRVSANEFTLDASTGNGTYVGSGLATFISVGSGTYIGGGRFWRDDEIPMHINRLIVLRRPFGSFIREARPVPYDFLTMKEKEDTDSVFAYSEYNAPAVIAPYYRGTRKYLRCYPAPVSDQTATLSASILPVARNYTNDALTCSLVLGSEFEDMIKHLVKTHLYDFLENDKRRQEEDALFFRAVNEYGLRSPKYTRLEVRYQ